MVLFGNNYDTSLKPDRSQLNLSVDPYMAQSMPFEHGIQPIAPSPYAGGPSEEAQAIGAVGDAVTGVANAYGQKKKMDAEKAYQQKLLAALGIGGSPKMPSPQSNMSAGESRIEVPASQSFVNDPAFQAAQVSAPATSVPATTATTPTGASNMQINGSPIPPTTPAPGTPSTGGTQASLAGTGDALSQSGLVPGGVLTNPNMSKTTLAANLLGTPDPSGASGLSGTYSGGSFAVSPLVTNYIAGLIGTK